MKKLLLLICLLGLLPTITYADSAYSIRHKDHIRQDYEIHVDFPNFDGLKNKHLEEEVNEEIKSVLEKSINQTQKAGEESVGFPVLYYGESIVVEEEQFYSVVMTANITRGNQYHSTVRSINFENEKDGVFLTLDEVAHLDKLNEQVKKKLVSDPETFNAQGFQGIRKDTAFYIKGKKLTLVFDKYEIASGVFGTPEITIPYDLVEKDKPLHKKTVPVPKVV
ncbi:RsiV family protein [Halobacillus campisalis]|uniref:RsiV family protein n=1 Tax=Halobacillus campisalis TaxID=435909 RepID=A0ABW2K0G5_9BACI|nr:RsiV family protein [Halobacillus campisalis]